MSDRSKIEWTDATWNPVTGCTKVSAGCKFCYAETFARRNMGRFAGGRKFTEVRCHPSALGIPAKWKKGRKIFVNSMSDLFHPGIPEDFRDQVFWAMFENYQHVFQVLTKRPMEMKKYMLRLQSMVRRILPGMMLRPRNVWLGVTVESADELWRAEVLKNTPADLRFISFEPLLGRIPDLDLKGIDWVIVGGETGHNPRVMKEDWVLDILEACRKYKVPFFFKQWGGMIGNPLAKNRELRGVVYNEFPVWSKI